MSSTPTQIPPSPIARSLLTFAKQSASGVVRLSGRRIGVCEGLVTGVEGSIEDPTAEQWLASLGQLSGAAESRAALMRAQGSLEREILAAIAPVGGTRSTVLTLWVVRLARAIEEADQAGPSSTVYLEGGQMPRSGTLPKISLARLCLEGLSRIAARSDMTWLNPHLSARLNLSAGNLQDEVLTWFGLPEIAELPSLRDILYADPSATTRVAALLRAGIAVIESNDPSMPPPPIKRAVTFSTAPAAPRALAYDANVPADESLPPPPAPTIALDDPLATLENELDILESSRAPAAERADQWKEIASSWQNRYGSLCEAARAYRHAAAAAPDDQEAHRLAAQTCARVGRLDLARSHAYAAFALCKTAQTRSAALRDCAGYAIADNQLDDALTLLRQASEYDPDDLETALIRWSLLASLGRLQSASEAARLAARLSMQSNPRRARALLGWAHNALREDVDLAQEFAMSLAGLEARSAGPWLVAQAVVERQRRRATDESEAESRPSLIPAAQALSAARKQLFGSSDAFSHPADASVLNLLEKETLDVGAVRTLLESAPDHPGVLWLSFSKAPELFLEATDAVAASERIRKLQASIGEQLSTLRYLSEQPHLSLDTRRRAHDLLCDIAPNDPTLILHRIRFLREAGETEAWKEALAQAASDDLFAGDQVFLDALSDQQAIAPEIALKIYSRRGRLNEQLGRRCADYVLSHPDANLQQRYVALDLNGDLKRIAQTAHEAEDWAAEARAWLRMLEDEPTHAGALERLTEIYTEAGEAKRAYATLCIRLSHTSETTERARLLTEIARWAKYHPELEADPESLVGALLESSLGSPLQKKVLALVDAMFQDQDSHSALLGMASRYPNAATVLVHHAIRSVSDADPSASETRTNIVMRGLRIVHAPSRLIPVLEHLVFETRDPEVAKRGFQILKQRAMGKHGRRALAYREGRLLLKIDCSKDALQSFAQAFSLLETPAEGTIFKALEEMSRRTDRWEALGEAQLQLASSAQIAELRRTYTIGAAETFENKLQNVNKAFEIYLQGWKSTGDNALAEEAKRVARKLKQADAKQAVTAFGDIVEHLRNLAEGAWDEEEKIDKLEQIAGLYALDCDAPELASATTEEALKLAQEAAPHRAAPLLCEFGTWMLNIYAKHDKAIECAERALSIDPQFAAAKSLLDQASGSREVLVSYPAVHTSVVPIPDTSRPAAEVESLREAARAGNMEAAASLRDLLMGQGQYEEATTLQHRILLQDPRRLEDVSRLYDLASLSGRTTLESIAKWLLESIEGLTTERRIYPPSIWPPPPPFTTPGDKAIGRGRQLLAAIWKHLGHRWGAVRPEVQHSMRARRTPSLDVSDFRTSYEAALQEPDAILITKLSEKELDGVLVELGGALGQLTRSRTMPTDLTQDGAREISAILSDYDVVPAESLISYIRGRCACLALEACSNLTGAFRYFVEENGARTLAATVEEDRAVRLLIRHVLSERALSAPPRRTTLSPAGR